MKKKYDSSVVFLYATGNEHLLPVEFRKKIPYSTISSWRKSDFGKYEGNQFRYLFDDSLQHLKLIHENKKMKKLLLSIGRSWVILSDYLNPVLHKKSKDKKVKKEIVQVIQRLKKQLGLKQALKLLNISHPQFYQWQLEVQFDCFDSFAALCLKNHPRQLSMKEITKIKNILQNPDNNHWPLTSIASDALRKKKVVASLYSWYKYAKLFKIKRKVSHKDRKREGLIGHYPNEYWHADLTYYPLENGQNLYITFLMDNFSKMILGYYVNTNRTFTGNVESLKMALPHLKKSEQMGITYLVTDGGKENVNHAIHDFLIKLSGFSIQRITALKDIQFSNSPVEAIHRTLKGRYLPRKKLNSIEQVNEHLKWAVHDYNELRPHYKHQ